jgi:hypothetical protein
LLARDKGGKLLTICHFGFNDGNVSVVINAIIAIIPLPRIGLLIPCTLVLLAVDNPWKYVTVMHLYQIQVNRIRTKALKEPARITSSPFCFAKASHFVGGAGLGSW